MAKLVIVESPAKAKTIEKYLGSDFKVVASVGHIRDLPKSKLGVDVENSFTPCYENKKEKAALIKELKAAAKKADTVYLATDPDREGEAISWHLAYVLGLDGTKPIRVTFSEITKSGIEKGMQSPRCLDMDLINAQQARRILDRLVGYKLSPFLWKKVRRGLSAGRVQSVAVRLIVDREREIAAFVSKEFWTIDGKFSTQTAKKVFEAHFLEKGGKKLPLESKEETDAVLLSIKDADFVVTKITKSVRKKQPSPPFTTSTLQQEASKKLGFNAKRTMKAAQELYEGVTVPNLGAVGLITYMRTDSLRISDEAKTVAKQLITDIYGEKYLPEKPREFKSKSNAQDAHEAVRPSIITVTPDMVKGSVTSDQYKLYKLIWERFLASQMEAALYNIVNVDIMANDCLFRANGYTVSFDGFTKLYEETKDDTEENGSSLPSLSKGDILIAHKVAGNQHFTQPPPRFNEAALIKALEENGIGRPSTYAPTISTILDRQYVERVAKQLVPTSLGEATTTLLEEQFKNIVDCKFTANMESKLDKVEAGETNWIDVMEEFYSDFSSTLSNAEIAMKDKRVKIPDEETDIPCEICGKNLVIKIGPYGKFLACSGFPDCKFTKKIVIEAAGICPKCHKKMIVKKSKKGKPFFACEDYKDCNYMTWDTPLADICPNCGSTLFKKSGKKGMIYCVNCEYSDTVQTAETSEDNDE